MPLQVTGFTIRQGAAYARGTSIDPLLSETEAALVYRKWQPSWPAPNEFHGGIQEITCEMVLEVPEKELRSTFGKNLAAKLTQLAASHAGR